jgi:hypothetical protein
MFGAIGTPAPGSGLHQCALCRAECVVPVWWESVGEDRWHMLLRCGACGTFRDVIAVDDVAQAYERDLQRGTREISAALDRLDRERMAEQASAFVVALQRDLIDAADFAGR